MIYSILIHGAKTSLVAHLSNTHENKQRKQPAKKSELTMFDGDHTSDEVIWNRCW
jgi:hypothetical protein